ncbi:hypothetical protein FSP39_008419 [Pinctada imbricata]|uniref:C1q domain-containing protein n=1 Tax=Pinctada imbricata TaxID=66713 RepID=A0AA88Y3L7_PINIB|nr:hypothetical protein FSP39_008419 [Pinctada imbricata]
MVHSGKYSHITVQVNGSSKAILYGYAKGYPTYYSPSQSYVTDLKKGDQVNLYSGSTTTHIHPPYSTFTGYRV